MFNAVRPSCSICIPASALKYEDMATKKSSKEDLFKDVFQYSPITDKKVEPEITQAPKIGIGRILFHRLTKEQIKAINKSGELPKNAKFVEFAGKIDITWNALDATEGTHKLPAGYEVKNDIFGFTHVVREGTKSLFIK